MKKIIIIDGGPRKTFNTASMLQQIAEGAVSVSEEIEVKTVRLYGMDYIWIHDYRTTPQLLRFMWE